MRYPRTEPRAKLAKIIKVKNKERIVNAVVGQRASGKTVQTKLVINRYIKKFPKEKVLILDSFNEYTEYKVVALDKIGSIKGVRRIDLSQNKSTDILKLVLHNFKNGLLVIEDSSHHYFNRIDLDALVVCQRTKDIDIIIISQSVQSLSTGVIANSSVFRFHRMIDSHRAGSRLLSLGIHSFADIAIFSVCNSVKKFPFVYFDNISMKIVGGNKKDVYGGCIWYLKDTVDSLLSRIMD